MFLTTEDQKAYSLFWESKKQRKKKPEKQKNTEREREKEVLQSTHIRFGTLAYSFRDARAHGS